MNTDKEHIPALDGIRGIAILLVLFYHFTPDLLMPDRAQEWIKKLLTTGGWIGVDLFFVLSGFLITGILLRTKNDPDYFMNFYARRALRIFPLYYATLAIIFLVLPALGFFSEYWFDPIRETQAFHWLYSTNFAFWLLPGEALSAHQIELRHLWSLAVEEHFYFLWPAVVWVLAPNYLKGVCVGLIASAFALRLLGVYFEAPPGYFTLTFCRWDALAAGALVALIINDSPSTIYRRRAPITAAILLGTATLVVYFFINKGLWSTAPAMVTFGLTIIATIFAGVVALATIPTGRLARVLAFEPLRFFGKYSYGLYIIHGALVPLLVFLFPADAWIAAFKGPAFAAAFSLVVVKVAICTLLAIISYHFFEMPFLGLKRYFDPSRQRPAKLPLRQSADPS